MLNGETAHVRMLRFVTKKWASRKQSHDKKPHVMSCFLAAQKKIEMILAVGLFGTVLSYEYCQNYVKIVDMLNFVALAWPQAHMRVYTSTHIPHSLRQKLNDDGADVYIVSNEPKTSEMKSFSAFLPIDLTIFWFQPFILPSYRMETLQWLNLCKDFVQSGRCQKKQEDEQLTFFGVVNQKMK